MAEVVVKTIRCDRCGVRVTNRGNEISGNPPIKIKYLKATTEHGQDWQEADLCFKCCDVISNAWNIGEDYED